MLKPPRKHALLLAIAATGLTACGSDGPAFKSGSGGSDEATVVFTTVAEALDITRSTLATPDFLANAVNATAEEIIAINLTGSLACAGGTFRLPVPPSDTRTAIEFSNCHQFTDGVNTIDGVLNGAINIETNRAGGDSRTVEFAGFSFTSGRLLGDNSRQTEEFDGDTALGTLIETNGDSVDFIISDSIFYRVSTDGTDPSEADLQFFDLDQQELTPVLEDLVQLDTGGLLEGFDFEGFVDFMTEVPVVNTGDIEQGTIMLFGDNDSFIRIVDSATANKADVEIDFDGDGSVDTESDLQWDWFGPNGILGRR